jgi:adenine-specific DNA methylase
MIPRDCKRLAEVDFPIAEVSRHSAREKSIRHGHPSTLHLWWARRPLAACRAMLMALLLPDPCDEHCPPEFKQEARILLARWRRDPGADDTALRKTLLAFIADFANWDNAGSAVYLEVSRGLVKAAHGEEPPLVVDPFAGGGSIPLEALRLGCDAFASDLNPVACLILKVMLEDIPRHGPGLADELRRVGAEIKAAAEKELAGFYPPDPDGARPIAYLWARTVRCESPNCGAEIPLVRSFWLSKKANRKRALRYRVERPQRGVPQVAFDLVTPKSDRDVLNGTVSRANASCPCCNIVLPRERVRAQLVQQRGGVDVVFDSKGRRTGGALLLAVVVLHSGENGRHYRLPQDHDYRHVWKAQRRFAVLAHERLTNGLSLIPDEPVDEWHHDVNRLPMYGMRNWGDAFTARQKVTLAALASASRERSPLALKQAIAAVISRLTDYGSAQNSWANKGEFVRGAFGRQALAMVWDYVETAPLSDASGNLDGSIDWVYRVVKDQPTFSHVGAAELADARESPLPNQTAQI